MSDLQDSTIFDTPQSHHANSKPAIERFNAKIKISHDKFFNGSPCWEWQGGKTKDGYGQFRIDGRRIIRKNSSPHRFAYMYFNGEIPQGYDVEHQCNNRGCCNPAHLDACTRSENQKRSYARGRKRIRTAPIPTHCRNGHEYTPENLIINSQGARVCRICNKRRCLAYQTKTRQHNTTILT